MMKSLTGSLRKSLTRWLFTVARNGMYWFTILFFTFFFTVLFAQPFSVSLVACLLIIVKGHTENEADTVHSTIERDKVKKKVFLPSEWPIVILNTPTEKFKMIVNEKQMYAVYMSINSLFRRRVYPNRSKTLHRPNSGICRDR